MKKQSKGKRGPVLTDTVTRQGLPPLSYNDTPVAITLTKGQWERILCSLGNSVFLRDEYGVIRRAVDEEPINDSIRRQLEKK